MRPGSQILAMGAVFGLAASLAAQTPKGLMDLKGDQILAPASREWERLGVSEREMRPLEHFYRGSDHEGFVIAYKSQKLHILGILARPYVKIEDDEDDQITYPLIILNHGSKHGVSPAYRAIALDLASRGYIVLASTYRGVAGLEGRSEGVAELAKGEVLDVLQLTELGRNLVYVDSQRMGILGVGHGAAITLSAIARSNVFKAAVAISPPVFSSLGEFNYAGRQRLPQLFQEYLGFELTRNRLVQELAARDTFRNLHRITTPLLVMTTDQDPSYRDLRLYAAALKERGIVHQYTEYPGVPPDFMVAADTQDLPVAQRYTRDRAWYEAFHFLDERLSLPEEEEAEDGQVAAN